MYLPNPVGYLKQHKLTAIVITTALLGVGSQTAHADFNDLLKAGLLVNYTEKELSSAMASQAVYDQLKTAGCDDQQAAATTTCGGGTYSVWRNVREVVHNANALSPSNENFTQYSLGRDTVAKLGGALQWCNGEEFASLNSLSGGFVSAQVNSLAARITALRMGSTGFSAGNFNSNTDKLLARNNTQARGGGASADLDDNDNTDEAWSHWGGFLSGNLIRGDKLATSQEDAFSFKGPTINAGLDKRIGNNWVTGAILGYQKQKLDFSTVATVEAYSDLRGLSVMPYLLYQSDRWYFNASLGYQNMHFDTHRRVNYASGPVATIPVAHDTFDTSTAKAVSWSSYDSVGFSMHPTAAWVIEPSLSIDYQHIKINQFTEADLNNQGFNFVIAEQAVTSLEAIPELRTQYTFTPRFGVWVPFIDAQWHHQFKTDARTVNALYADAQASLNSAASFAIKTDTLDSWYQIYSAGFSAILRGSSANADHNSGSWQIYANYRRYEGLRNFTQQIVAAGVRYEF